MFANLTLRERRLLKQAQVGATISFILLFVPILTIILLHTSDLLAKWLGIVGVIMVLPLLYFAWQILKIAYKDQKDNPTPFVGSESLWDWAFDQSLSPVWKVNFYIASGTDSWHHH